MMQNACFLCTYREYPKKYDMLRPEVDTQEKAEELTQGPHSAPWTDLTIKALTVIYTHTHKRYVTASAEAETAQRKHMRLSFATLIFGTSAIIIAIVTLLLMGLGLAGDESSIKLLNSAGEILAIIIAFTLVVIGSRGKYHTRWLINRHIAEQLRLLKFRFLLDPRLWCGDRGIYPENIQGWEDDIKREAEQIASLTEVDLKACMDRQQVPEPPSFACPISSDWDLRGLIDYYMKKRIDYQRNYYCGKILKSQAKEEKVKNWPDRLFYASVAMVLLHFFFDLVIKFYPNLYPNLGEFLEHPSTILLGFAVLLPVIGFAIKSYRSSRQLAPVTSIFISKFNLLGDIEDRINSELGYSPAPWERINKILHQCEILLAAEHHEWLILMHELDLSP